MPTYISETSWWLKSVERQLVSYGMLYFGNYILNVQSILPHARNKGIMKWRYRKVKGRQLLGIKPRTPLAWGASALAATEPQQPDNHQPSQSSYMYCTGGSHTPTDSFLMEIIFWSTPDSTYSEWLLNVRDVSGKQIQISLSPIAGSVV